jgi:hypothetical protein
MKWTVVDGDHPKRPRGSGIGRVALKAKKPDSEELRIKT